LTVLTFLILIIVCISAINFTALVSNILKYMQIKKLHKNMPSDIMHIHFNKNMPMCNVGLL